MILSSSAENRELRGASRSGACPFPKPNIGRAAKIYSKEATRTAELFRDTPPKGILEVQRPLNEDSSTAWRLS